MPVLLCCSVRWSFYNFFAFVFRDGFGFARLRSLTRCCCVHQYFYLKMLPQRSVGVLFDACLLKSVVSLLPIVLCRWLASWQAENCSSWVRACQCLKRRWRRRRKCRFQTFSQPFIQNRILQSVSTDSQVIQFKLKACARVTTKQQAGPGCGARWAVTE